jgi:hypothetical protein
MAGQLLEVRQREPAVYRLHSKTGPFAVEYGTLSMVKRIYRRLRRTSRESVKHRCG